MRSWWLRRAWSPSRSPPTCRQTSRRGRAGRSGWCRSRAEVALAGGLLRLLAAPSDRLPWSQTVDWTVALDWLGRSMRRHAGPRAGRGGTAGADGAGGGAHRRAGLWQELQRARHRRPGPRQASQGGAGRADRSGGQTAVRAGRIGAALHRLLQLRPGSDAAFDRDHPLDADLVVVDETSMLDVLLANKLVKASHPPSTCCWSATWTSCPASGPARSSVTCWPPSGCPGAADQGVPPGPAGSGWCNAHRINAGRPPITRGLADFFLFPEDDADQVADLVVDVADHRPALRPRPGPRGAGAVPDAPRAGRRGRAERAAPGGADASARGACRASLRWACLPGRRQGDAGQEQLRQGHRRGVQRVGRGGHRAVPRTASCGSGWTRTRRWATGSTSWIG